MILLFDQECKFGDRRCSDTVIVLTLNYIIQELVMFSITLLEPYEKLKHLDSGGSMVARLKLKGIDGRAPQDVDSVA